MIPFHKETVNAVAALMQDERICPGLTQAPPYVGFGNKERALERILYFCAFSTVTLWEPESGEGALLDAAGFRRLGSSYYLNEENTK